MGKRYRGTYAFKTDVGKVRISNEDQASVRTNPHGEVFLVVCDGMGGQNKGDYASKLAIDCLNEAFDSKPRLPFFLMKLWLGQALKKANSLIFNEAESKSEYHDMGTTCVCALICGENLLVANIGDSRAYLSTPSSFMRGTQDQTYVNYLYNTGKIEEREILSHPDRHVLMNALGIFPSISVDFKRKKYHGESILLCSDGLYNNLPENEIHAVISTDERADQKVASLIAEANANGGSDNIGVAYWEAIVE